MKAGRQVWLAAACCVVILAVVLSILSMRYAAGTLESLRSEPGYVSAEQAMREMLPRDHRSGTTEIYPVVLGDHQKAGKARADQRAAPDGRPT